jgi:hypothetical protein
VTANQNLGSDAWIGLGTFQLSAGARVSLNNVDCSASGYDVAWDAMAVFGRPSPYSQGRSLRSRLVAAATTAAATTAATASGRTVVAATTAAAATAVRRRRGLRRVRRNDSVPL